jgi:hypothetical protein
MKEKEFLDYVRYKVLRVVVVLWVVTQYELTER